MSSFAFSQRQRGPESLPLQAPQAEAGMRKLKQELDRLKDKDPREARRFKKKFERWAGVAVDYEVQPRARAAATGREDERGRRVRDPDEPIRDDAIYEL